MANGSNELNTLLWIQPTSSFSEELSAPLERPRVNLSSTVTAVLTLNFPRFALFSDEKLALKIFFAFVEPWLLQFWSENWVKFVKLVACGGCILITSSQVIYSNNWCSTQFDATQPWMPHPHPPMYPPPNQSPPVANLSSNPMWPPLINKIQYLAKVKQDKRTESADVGQIWFLKRTNPLPEALW